MLNRFPLIIFSIGIVIATYGACARQDSKVWTTTRLPDDFTEGSYTLSCVLATEGTLHSWSWNYFTTDEYTNIEIYDGVQLTSKNNTYTSSLTLDDYNAGTYQCWFYLTNASTPSVNATFKISETENGADLYESCTEDHDCNALHATCTDSHYLTYVCQCSGQYNITYTSGSDTLACLKLQPEGGHCYSQNECDWPTQSYSCKQNQCTCTVTMMDVDGTEKELCIKPAYLYGSCYYDEQCQMTTEHSYCYQYEYGMRYCNCEEGYSIKYSYESSQSNYCYYVGLRGWEIACIVLGILVGLSTLCAASIYTVYKSK